MGFLISCPTCSYTTNKTFNICRHLKTVHHLTDDAVNEFKKRIVSNKALETHGSGAFSCGYCNHIVATKDGLDSHIRRKHPKPLINPADISLSTSPPIQAPPEKIYNHFNEIIENLCQKMRKMKRNPENLEEMKNVLKLVEEANNGIPGTSAESALPLRRDHNGPRKSARQTMHHSKNSKLPIRRKAARQEQSQKWKAALKTKKDPAICSVCWKVDPVLPIDMDDEEQDARETEWVRCTNPSCKLQAHFLCSGDTCHCCDVGKFERYLPSGSSGSSDTSNSASGESTDDETPGQL